MLRLLKIYMSIYKNGDNFTYSHVNYQNLIFSNRGFNLHNALKVTKHCNIHIWLDYQNSFFIHQILREDV